MINRKSEIVICGHINLLPIAFFVRLLLRGRSPIVLIVHGIDAWQPSQRLEVNWLARKVDAVISVSEFTREKFWKWARPHQAKSFILPNCVDLQQFTPGPKNHALARRYGLEGKCVLLTLARLDGRERYKGIDEVLEALPLLIKELPSVSYLIVGDGSDRERLTRKVNDLGIPTRVVFTGPIPESEKADHYRLADVYVMPGRGEGFGIVYLEAMACGVPVIASKLDASQELVSDLEQGIAVDPDNTGELRAAILQALKKRSANPPAKLAKYSWDAFRGQVATIIYQCNRDDAAHALPKESS